MNYKHFKDDIFNLEDHLRDHQNIGFKLSDDRVDNPDISVMIPTYKRPELLKKAIASVLNQKTSFRYEIVVVDNDPLHDNENDSLVLSLEDSRIRYCQNEDNIGMFGNWNRCLSLAGAEWVLILSDDDELKEDYIQKMMSIALKQKECAAVSCDHDLIDENGNVIGRREGFLDRLNRNRLVMIRPIDFYFRHPIMMYGCLINKRIAVEVGGFDEKFYPCSDASFLLNASIVSKTYVYGEHLFRYRWAENESTKTDTQITYLYFNNSKSFQINRRFRYFNKRTDLFLRNAIADSSLQVLLQTNMLNEEDAKAIKKDMGLSESLNQIGNRVLRFCIRLCKLTSYLSGKRITFR